MAGRVSRLRARVTRAAGRRLRRVADAWDPLGSHRWLSLQEALARNAAALKRAEARIEGALAPRSRGGDD